MWGLGFLCALVQLIFLPLHSPFPFKRPLNKETWESYVTVCRIVDCLKIVLMCQKIKRSIRVIKGLNLGPLHFISPPPPYTRDSLKGLLVRFSEGVATRRVVFPKGLVVRNVNFWRVQIPRNKFLKGWRESHIINIGMLVYNFFSEGEE